MRISCLDSNADAPVPRGIAIHRRHRDRWIIAATAVVLTIGVTALVVLGQRDDAPRETVVAPAAPSSGSATQQDATVPTPAASTSAAASAGPEDVRGLPAGLFCRDLNGRGYSYVATVDYWRANGQPNQMDEDRNGIPCQTVYSPLDVSSYWGVNTVPQRLADAVDSLPSGLFCRDLLARGYSYSDAVSYWFVYGQPDQMDVDMNGIPCETVYPRALVDDFWF